MTKRTSTANTLRKLRQGGTSSLLTQIVSGRTLSVTRRAEVEAGLKVGEPYALISLFDPDRGQPVLPHDPDRLTVLYLACHDTKRSFDDRDLPPGVQPLTLTQARQISDLLEQHNGAAIVVHCHQGMSRSPAVAAAISEHLNGDPSFWFERRLPNKTVFELVRRSCRPRGDS